MFYSCVLQLLQHWLRCQGTNVPHLLTFHQGQHYDCPILLMHYCCSEQQHVSKKGNIQYCFAFGSQCGHWYQNLDVVAVQFFFLRFPIPQHSFSAILRMLILLLLLILPQLLSLWLYSYFKPSFELFQRWNEPVSCVLP